MFSSQIIRHAVAGSATRISYLSPEPAPDGAPPMVLIHGSGVSARYWREQLEGLADAARILAVDLPGHGESDPIDHAGVDEYAGAVVSIVRTLDLGRSILVGHSLGGAVALTAAARRPDLVRALVMLSSCAKLPPPDAALEHLFAWLPGPLRKLVFFATAKKLLFSPTASPRAVRLAMDEIRSCRLETLQRDIAAAKAMDVTDLARGVNVATLVLCGSRDALTPPALSAALCELIPNARVSLVEGAGHMLHLEAPQRVNDEIRTFIASLPTDAKASPCELAPSEAPARLSRHARAIRWLRRVLRR